MIVRDDKIELGNYLFSEPLDDDVMMKQIYESYIHNIRMYIYIYIYIYTRGAFNKFSDFFVEVFRIVVCVCVCVCVCVNKSDWIW